MNAKIKKYLPFIIPFCVLLIVGGIALTHKPLTSFDETNTIRIISQPIRDIFAILNEEPNFPLFYIILKFVWELLFRNVFLLQLVYFMSYIVGGIYFYKLLHSLIQNEKNLPLYLSLYYALPSIVYNAYFIRMYNIAITLGLAALFYLVSFAKSSRSRDLYLSIGILSLLMMLHPIGLLLGLLGLIILFAKELTNNQRMVVLGFLVVGILSWLLQLVIKTDLFRIYLTIGPKYMKILNDSFFSSGFLFHFSGVEQYQEINNALIGFPLGVAIVVEVFFMYGLLFLRKGLSFLDRIALGTFGLFFIIPMLFGSKIYIHHLHYLLPFGIFCISYIYSRSTEKFEQKIRKSWKLFATLLLVFGSILLTMLSKTTLYNSTSLYSLYVGIVLAVTFISVPRIRLKLVVVVQLLFLLAQVLYYLFFLNVDGLRCSNLRSLASDRERYLITQYNYMNGYIGCLDSSLQLIMIDENKPLYYLGNHNQREILIEQARRGGSLGTYQEMLEVFSQDTSLLEYNIKKIYIRIDGFGDCQKMAIPPSLKGYAFEKCGEFGGYLYNRSQ